MSDHISNQRHRSDHLATSLRRPISDSLQVKRPSSEFHSRPISANVEYKTPEAEVIDKWFEDLGHYEKTLDSMSKATLDDNFKDELKAMENWFTVLSNAEQTSALYSLLKNCNQVQVRFFLTVLQQMLKMDLPDVQSHRGTNFLLRLNCVTVKQYSQKLPAVQHSRRYNFRRWACCESKRKER